MGFRKLLPQSKKESYQNAFRHERIFFVGKKRKINFQIVGILTGEFFEKGVDVVVGKAADFLAPLAVRTQAR